jgi:GT2 family glycosyltransferase
VRVGAARNAAASAAADAGADLLVFLDVDCLPAPDLVDRYHAAARRHPDALLSGPVTYLASPQRPSRPDELVAMRRTHRARPALASGRTRAATPDEYDLFWSLSFAVTRETWARLGGFHPRYEGYGAEDTDLGRAARERGVPLRWVGGAHAFHQWHPVSSPPWQHLDDILRNGAVFAERWGEWPMRGWLDAFAAAGAIEAYAGGWRRVR